MEIDLNVGLGDNEDAPDLSLDFHSGASIELSSDDVDIETEVISGAPNTQHSTIIETDSPAEGNRVGWSNAEVVADIEKKLQIGATFGSLEQAYIFYCEYGRLKGFSVRRGDQRYKGSTGKINWKEFVCHCKGPDCGGRQGDGVRKLRRQHKRSQCLAKIRFYAVNDGDWKNTIFIEEHNHPLLAPDQSHLLRSSRLLTEARLALIQSMNSVGIPVTVACNFMEEESGGPSNVGYIRKDVYNRLHSSKKDKIIQNGDSIALLEFFNKKAEAEPCFFWRGRYDDEDRLLHVFYRDSRCLTDYECFGDVLSIDTTYKTNKYGLSCAPFVGLNHHSTTVMFGIGFLSNEKTETFNWLLSVFLEAMKGKQPKVVFSDQCKALMNAIDTTLPNSAHRLCQWHINNNAVKHFGSLNGNEEFKRMWFKCMNWVESEEEFGRVWSEMISKHVTDGNDWLNEIYTLRRRWASVFTQDIFRAGMVSTGRSEGTNKVLKAMISSCTSLYEFACAYEKVQSRWRDVERAEDAACLWLPGQFVKKNEMLTQAATLYTRKIFKLFETQCTEVYNVVVDWRKAVYEAGGNIVFKATRAQYPNARPRTVTLNEGTKSVRCSCHMWETHGYFCRHVLKVYQIMDVQVIPAEFILKRWTKNAKDIVFSEHAEMIRRQEDDLTRFLDFKNLLMRWHYEMIIASKGCSSAQNYLLHRMESTKHGFQTHVMEKNHGVTDATLPKESNFQFKNPNKVKQRGPVPNKKKGPGPSKGKRSSKNKIPGISTRSRKRGKNDDGPSFSNLDLNISLSQPVGNSGNQPSLNILGMDADWDFGLFSTQ